MEDKNPRVFICHASEDKERFVLRFARELRRKGVDAWVDKWEMLKGDSLTQKIFEEGLKNAQAMVIILSKNSINKKWVKKEIDTGFMKHMEGSCKLIPVILDDVRVPEILKSNIWTIIENPEDFHEQLDEIIASIYEISTKPALGESPKYAILNIDSLPGLTQTDTLIFNNICQLGIEQESPWIRSSDLQVKIKELDIPKKLLIESIDILEEQYYISGTRTYGEYGLNFFKITEHGFENFAISNIPEYNEFIRDVLLAIINEDLKNDRELSEELGIPFLVVDYIIQKLKDIGAIIASTTAGGTSVVDVKPKGHRLARTL
jgi:hypothetical protein